MTDEQILELALALKIPDEVTDETLLDFARALLASKPAEDDSVADGELIADLIEENRTLQARLAAAPTAPAQPCGEGAAILRRLQNTLQLNYEIGAENAAIYAETLDRFLAARIDEDADNGH